MKKCIKAIFSQNRLPFILFLIIFINYLPLFQNNLGLKISNAVTVKQMVIAFGIEGVLLFIYLIRSVKINLKFTINVVLLIITTGIMGFIQYNNYKNGTLQKMDIANIGCIAINIAALYIAFLNVKIEEKHIYKFFVRNASFRNSSRDI